MRRSQCQSQLALMLFPLGRSVETQLNEGSTRREKYSNGFVLVYIPLDCSSSPHVMYLHPKENGACNSLAHAFDTICTFYRNCFIPVWFKATDGDRYLTREHDDLFDHYVAPYLSGLYVAHTKLA